MELNKKIEQFEIFRFIGIISIVIYHTARKTQIFDNIPVIMKAGYIWNYYYFLLSGFLFSISYFNKEVNYKQYIKKRILKFYPIYLIALIIIIFSKENINIIGLLVNLSLMQSLIFYAGWNYPSWFLSVLFVINFLAPYLLKKMKNSYREFVIFTVILSILTYMIYYFLYSFSSVVYVANIITYNPLMYLSTFCIGMCCVLIKKIQNFKISKISGLSIIYFFFLVFFIEKYGTLVIGFPLKYKNIYFSELITLSWVPFIILLYFETGIIYNILSNKLFIFFGGLAFEIYLLHIPILQLFVKYRGEIITNVLWFEYLTYTIFISIVINTINKKILKKIQEIVER